MAQPLQCIVFSFRRLVGALINPSYVAVGPWSHPAYNVLLPSCRSFHGSCSLHAPPPKKGAAGGAFKAGMTVTKKKFDVETDPYKLVNYLCGGQYLKEGPEVKLEPDSAYPDWLWNLRTTGPPPLSEMDPGTIEYWMRVKELRWFEYKRLLKATRGRHWLLKSKLRKERQVQSKKEAEATLALMTA